MSDGSEVITNPAFERTTLPCRTTLNYHVSTHTAKARGLIAMLGDEQRHKGTENITALNHRLKQIECGRKATDLLLACSAYSVCSGTAESASEASDEKAHAHWVLLVLERPHPAYPPLSVQLE